MVYVKPFIFSLPRPLSVAFLVPSLLKGRSKSTDFFQKKQGVVQSTETKVLYMRKQLKPAEGQCKAWMSQWSIFHDFCNFCIITFKRANWSPRKTIIFTFQTNNNITTFNTSCEWQNNVGCMLHSGLSVVLLNQEISHALIHLNFILGLLRKNLNNKTIHYFKVKDTISYYQTLAFTPSSLSIFKLGS